MNNDFEYQRRQLWIDHMRDQWNRGFKGDSCLESCDVLLAEFDKRFPQPTQSGIMDQDEFNKWCEKETKRMINSRCDMEQTDNYISGAWAAYRLLTVKE